MKLLPGWQSKIDQSKKQPPRRPLRVPLSSRKLSREIQIIRDVGDADRMVQFAYEERVSYISMDTEFRFEADAPILLKGKKWWRDIRSVQPFCLAFAVVGTDVVVRFALDLRLKDLLPAIQAVLDLPVPYVCHYAPAELVVLWRLGFREPRVIWDTLLAEKALCLGRRPTRAQEPALGELAEEIRKHEEAKEVNKRYFGLDAVARRHGIPVTRSSVKHSLQESFLTKPFDEPLTDEELQYCAEDAEITALIREPQRVACDRTGICEVLDGVLMPWNVTAAEIKWTGVKFDWDKCQKFCLASVDLQSRIAHELNLFGIDNPSSPRQIAGLIEREQLADHFPRTNSGQVCTSDKWLEIREHLHPAFPLVRRYRKIRILAEDPAVTGLIEGTDGRVHADIVVLGADSGRTQSNTPNLMGIGRPFRPLVCATPGCGIGDVDLSQIEVGIAAAVFHDRQMIEDFNSGDVYAAQAKRIFAVEIPVQDLLLPDSEFKSKYKALRNRCKPLALGIIYGKTIYGLATDLRISKAEARKLWNSFRDHYPDLCRGMEDAREQSARRGYAYICGLRRWRQKTGEATTHEKRGLGNAYVQGTAALVFFHAGNRLRRLYQQHGARLIVPVHDAFVFEAPTDKLQEVAELTKRVMIETVQEWFPELLPRAEINIQHPECWNYEGHYDSVERFIEDPTLQL